MLAQDSIKRAGDNYCCSLFNHSGENEVDGVRYFSSRESLRASRSCFTRLRGRWDSRIESIQSSASDVLDESRTFSRAVIRESAMALVET
jgi:hypothetical protein